MPSAQARAFFGGGGAQSVGGDLSKAARAIYGIAHDSRVGLRVPLGLDSIAGPRTGFCRAHARPHLLARARRV